MRKIGFFGGSFDPIHFGHVNLCLSVMEKHHLDQVLFCPASVSPFKGAAPPHLSQIHRREMLQLALVPFPQFQLLDLELQRPGPSYTIDSVRVLHQRFEVEKKSVQLHLILGEDTLPHLSLWKEIEELIQLAPPLIGSRRGEHSFTMPPLSPQALDTLAQGITPIPLMEISSTVIRERLSQQKTCRHLVPANVLDYIEAHRLYSRTL